MTSPVHLNLLARFSRDMHGRFGSLTILTVVVAELRIHKWCFTAGTVFLAVLGPEQ